VNWKFSNSRFGGLLFLISTVFLSGCCGFIGKYELFLIGEPKLDSANVYLDNKLIAENVSGDKWLCMSYGKYEIKIIQKGFKPFIDTLYSKRGDRSEQSLLVELKPFDTTFSTHPEMPRK